MSYRNVQPSTPEYDSDVRWQGTTFERNLAWIQIQIPTADLNTWTPEELESFSSIVARHCCSVCGRWDDEGCIEGC